MKSLHRSGKVCIENGLFNYNKNELETYDKYWGYVHVEKTLRDEAYLTGLTKGEQQGMEKGMVKGMEKGMEQVAKKMLSDNESIDKIIKFTGLSAKQIGN